MKNKLYLLLSTLIIFIIIFFSLFYFNNKIISFFPQNAKLALEVYKIDKNFWKLRGHSYSINSLKNDYNVKFLPETQFLKVKYIKKNILIDENFKKKSNNQEQSSSIYKKFDGLNYIDLFSSDTMIINDNNGKIYSWKIDINEILNEKKLIFNSIPTNRKDAKILDLLVNDDEIFISYIFENKDCKYLNISNALMNLEKLEFDKFFISKDCSTKSVYGGRIQPFNFKGKEGILFTTSEVDINNPNMNSQDENSSFGKILFFDKITKNNIIFSKGHRNPHGLFVDEENDVILSTEHGPRGGDEINKIEFNKNYGWPLASYGERYTRNEVNPDLKYKKNHLDNNFIEPIYSFVPSIGISEIIKIPNSFSQKWQNNYFVTSLNDKSLYRVNFSKDFSKLIYLERIYVGNRIRDIKYDYENEIFILSLQDSNQIGFLFNDERTKN